MIPRRIGALFAGTGGLDLAAAAVWGAEVAWYAETNRAACKVLAKRFPYADNLGDVTGIDWAEVPYVDIVTGGFPCQDISSAGRGAGIDHGTRSGLWLAMASAVEAIQPRMVVVENVRGIVAAKGRPDSRLGRCPVCVGHHSGAHMRALGTVLGDLATLGYDARWRCVEAAQVGAPHHRLRLFLAAYPQGVPVLAPTPASHGYGLELVAPPTYPLLPTPTPFHSDNTESPARWLERREDVQERTGGRHGIALPVVARSQAEGALLLQAGDGPVLVEATDHPWGPYAEGVERWAAVQGPPPPATHLREGHRVLALSAPFPEWMMGLPRGWVTDTDVSWKQQLRLLGNGVCPQQAEAALRSLLGGS